MSCHCHLQKRILELVDADTLLCGHALDNDLRSLRLVHANVVDSAALYPHPQGPPYRSGLRVSLWQCARCGPGRVLLVSCTWCMHWQYACGEVTVSASVRGSCYKMVIEDCVRCSCCAAFRHSQVNTMARLEACPFSTFVACAARAGTGIPLPQT